MSSILRTISVAPLFLAFAASCSLRVGEGSLGGDSATGPTSPDYGKPPSATATGAGGAATTGVGGSADVATSSSDTSATGVGGGPASSTAATTSVTTATSSVQSSATGGGNGCYFEPNDPNASLSDLKASYKASTWVASMLSVLDRRYPTGFYVVDKMKNDPWLKNDLPQYYPVTQWSGMIEAIDTACHEETHGYDFDTALGFPGKHVYYHGKDLQIAVPKLNFFPRGEILAEVQKGGSVTSNYDSTYLTGSQGSSNFVYLADELTAYINGLACVTTVVDHLDQGSSFRDGVASHLYFMEVYMRVARTKYPSLYATWKADAAWQKFVRTAWARGHFWYQEALPYPLLGSKDGPIWARVQDPTNRSEIELFTGEDPAVVACSP